MKFAQRLSEFRKEKGLSQQKLAGLLFVDHSTISKLEKGTRQPSLELLVIIAKFFDTSADYLLGLKDFE